MRKIRKFCLSLIAALFVMSSTNLSASDIRVTFNGEYLDIVPEVMDDRSLLPARFITDLLGGEVNWQPETRQVMLEIGHVVIVLYIDSNFAYVNGTEVVMDVAATLFNDITHVPLRFVAENFGVDVYFCEDTRTIILTTEVLQATLRLISVTNEVRRGERASITMTGQPNTEYKITVMFATGPSTAQGLEPAFSDDEGFVTWTWLIGSNTSFGTFEIIVAEVDAEDNSEFVVPFSVIE